MEAILINVAVDAGIMALRVGYDYAKERRNKKKNISNNNMSDKESEDPIPEELEMELKSEIIQVDDLSIASAPDIEDIYELSSCSDEETNLIKNKKSITETVLNQMKEKPLTIKSKKTILGFNPSKIMDTIRNVTPSRLRSKVVETVKSTDDNSEFDKFINNLITFIVYEIKAQKLDTEGIQKYEDYTNKLIYSLTHKITPVKKDII